MQNSNNMQVYYQGSESKENAELLLQYLKEDFNISQDNAVCVPDADSLGISEVILTIVVTATIKSVAPPLLDKLEKVMLKLFCNNDDHGRLQIDVQDPVNKTSKRIPVLFRKLDRDQIVKIIDKIRNAIEST